MIAGLPLEDKIKKLPVSGWSDIAEGKNRIGEWVFHHGMLFLSPYKWWESPGNRKTIHEGIDILFFIKVINLRLTYDATYIPIASLGQEKRVGLL